MCILIGNNERWHINNTEHMLHHTSDKQEKLKVLTHPYPNHSLQMPPSKPLLIRTHWQFSQHPAQINLVEATPGRNKMLIHNSIVWETEQDADQSASNVVIAHMQHWKWAACCTNQHWHHKQRTNQSFGHTRAPLDISLWKYKLILKYSVAKPTRWPVTVAVQILWEQICCRHKNKTLPATY